MTLGSETFCESADSIVAAATLRGINFTKERLGDWHREGLIPAPRHDFPGGGGSCSVYPQGTLLQAVECQRFLSKGLSFREVGWKLWVAGFSVREDVWKGHFVKSHQTVIDFCIKYIERDEVKDEFYRDLKLAIHAKRLPSLLGGVRRSVGKLGLKIILDLLVSVLAGAYRELESSDDRDADIKSIGRLTGLQQASKKKLIAGSPILPDSPSDFASRLALMSPAISKLRDPNFMRDCSVDVLCLARNEYQILVRAYTEIRKKEAKMVGCFDPFALFAAKYLGSQSPHQQAVQILGWLVCREIPEWKDGFARLLAEVHRAIPENSDNQIHNLSEKT